MKGLMCGGLLVLAALCASAAAPTSQVWVIKTDCNLRAKPLVTSEVVGQVTTGVALIARSLGPEWVEVAPPAAVDLWVLGDYVTNGVIESRQKVNVRAGAGINFSIVGQLIAGDRVDVRGAQGDWVRIAPPPGCSLWISRALVSTLPPAPPAPSAAPVALAAPPAAATRPARLPTPPAAAPVQTAAVYVPAVAPRAPEAPTGDVAAAAVPACPAVDLALMPPAPAAPPPGLDLIEAVGQGRWREVDGMLRPKDFVFRAPSDFRLVSADGDRQAETLCFVLGNRAQLEGLLYRRLRIGGREYWLKRQKYPVLVPERIQMK